MSHKFNSISNRIMRVDYSEYVMVLKKFLDYVENNQIIMEYINLGIRDGYNARAEWELVLHKDGYMFNFGPDVEEETYQIYAILRYIADNINNPAFSFRNIYGKQKWQDNVREFNDRVVLVFINNISDYLTGIGIDMGLDENIVWNVSGGQVNYARDNATVYATQNNGASIKELAELAKAITDDLSELNKEDADTIIDSLDMINEELMKPEPKRKIISNGIKLLAPMISIANGIPTLANNIQNFIQLAKIYLENLSL